MRLDSLRLALLCLVLAVGACGRPPSGSSTTQTTTEASGASGAAPGSAASAQPESAGLVGPGATQAERIEVVDVGPPGISVLITASLKGYTEPCGCTIDLVLGGIDRVTGFVEAVAALSTGALVVDAGNTLFEHETISEAAVAQEERKAEVIVAALRAMGTAATVPGPTDLARGIPFYLDAMQRAGVTVVASNVAGRDGSTLGQPWLLRPTGEEQIAIIGAVDPARFGDRSPAVATDALAAVNSAATAARAAGATTVIALFQGDLAAARTQLGDMVGVDFLVIGHAPRRSDEVERVGSAQTLEAYDQGRYVGRLKLVSAQPEGSGAPASGSGDGSGEAASGSRWASARIGSNEEIAQLEAQIEGIRTRLAQLPPTTPGDPEPPIVATQRARITDLEARVTEMRSTAPQFDPTRDMFLWQPTAMEPGYATNDAITAEMVAYNAALRELNARVVESVAPVPEGHAGYVGLDRCATCHVEETAFWRTTAHAGAWQTLVDRDKDFDRNCVGCHVTGYQQPGGAVLGHLDGLHNIQCEQCHGPGSLHVTNPVLNNVPGGVVTQVTEATCAGSCHVPEHSPRFDYATYLQRIVGPGHGG